MRDACCHGGEKEWMGVNEHRLHGAVQRFWRDAKDEGKRRKRREKRQKKEKGSQAKKEKRKGKQSGHNNNDRIPHKKERRGIVMGQRLGGRRVCGRAWQQAGVQPGPVPSSVQRGPRVQRRGQRTWVVSPWQGWTPMLFWKQKKRRKVRANIKT